MSSSAVVQRMGVATTLKLLPRSDHRQIGLRQELYQFHKLSRGSCFFLPNGAHIYNKLVDFLRQQYKKRNYQEVITPNIFDDELWKISGHWDYYKDNMIKCNAQNQDYSLKPMNCPAHCLMYKNLPKLPSSNHLPIRWADFGALHRNELSGSLLGLTRLRRFQQDDAHIFCRPDQVQSEVLGCLNFAKHLYGMFDLDLKFALSLRPENNLGEPELWDKAEGALRSALAQANLDWEEQEQEGAFYGPKIDLTVSDIYQRRHQCATIQLDFQLPERFDLFYKEATADRGSGKTQRPVIIHRAIMGSVERFMAVLGEHCDGRWPFWLSPLQVKIIALHPNFHGYARQVRQRLMESDISANFDEDSCESFKSQIHNAITKPYHIIVVLGKREAASETVCCRITKPTPSNYPARSSERSPTNELAEAGALAEGMTPSADSDRPQPNETHHISLPLNKFVHLLEQFADSYINRADLELLAIEADGGGARNAG